MSEERAVDGQKRRSRRNSKLFGWMLVTGLVALLGAIVWSSGRSGLATRDYLSDRGLLTRPIRLEAVEAGAVEELLLGLRVHHYRAQPQGDAQYVDFFYDTPAWELYESGYSYRVRIARGSDPARRYTVWVEREPRFLGPEEEKLDLRSQLPVLLGDAITSGSWQQAVSAGEGLEAPARLRRLLPELGIEPGRLAPRLRAELLRRRFDVTDKGRSWFELDLEDWTFRWADAVAGGPEYRTRSFVLDTRLSGSDPELVRRVKTMVMMSGMFHKSRPTDLAPHEQAIHALALSPDS